MKLNTKPAPILTHEGAVAKRVTPELQLRRSVMSCLLWEDEFYESGVSIAARIAECVSKVKPETALAVAVEAREEMKLRHVPLLIVRVMASLPTHRRLVAEALERVIQRPDEITEFLAIYWKDARCPLAKQVKLGLGRAFNKFEEYALAKYNRPGAIKLKDALFLSHAKPKDSRQAELFRKLANDELATPDTWEVALSSGGNAKEHWTRLLAENKLGALALIRNLRNFQKEGVETELVLDRIRSANVSRVLPFRFVAAARHAPWAEAQLDEKMIESCKSLPRLQGRTALLIDVSYSMIGAKVSERSEMTRLDAACALGAIAREICDNVRAFSFSDQVVEVPARRGMGMIDAIARSQPNRGTHLGGAIKAIHASVTYDRLIVITDEQTADRTPDPLGKGYCINVASYRNGIGYGAWTHIDGFSENVLRWIHENERF